MIPFLFFFVTRVYVQMWYKTFVAFHDISFSVDKKV